MTPAEEAAPDASPVLKIEGLTKRFGRLLALRSVNLELSSGQCLTLFGRNGAGKSTLLNATSSLIRSYEGDISLMGRNLRNGDEETRRAVGLVSHETYLYYDLSTEDNLRFYARLYGLSDVEGRVRRMLERFDIEVKAKSPARDLSRGMKQRLSLARVFLHDPQLLLLDEPFTGLDEPGCETLSKMIGEFVGGGGAALVTTHDLDRGLEVATRVAVLERGVIAYEADTSELDRDGFRSTYRELLAG
jgi:heme exporter protein A